MRHLEARTLKLGDFGGDVRHIVELGGPEKAGLGVDQRYSYDPEDPRQLVRLHRKRFLKKTPHAPIEIFEEAAVEHDASRVAVTPFDRELPAEDEIGHARVVPVVAAEKPARAQDVKSSEVEEKACRPAMQRKSTKTGLGVVNGGARDGCADPALAVRFADVEVCPVQFEFLRSADPHSPIAPANWEPAPAAVVVVVGINARSTKATAEMGEAMELGDVMEPAQVIDGVETAAEVTGTVDAAMERRVHRRDPPRAVAMVGARAAATTAAVTASAVFRSRDLSPLQAVHPRLRYRRRLTRR